MKSSTSFFIPWTSNNPPNVTFHRNQLNRIKTIWLSFFAFFSFSYSSCRQFVVSICTFRCVWVFLLKVFFFFSVFFLQFFKFNTVKNSLVILSVVVVCSLKICSFLSIWITLTSLFGLVQFFTLLDKGSIQLY